MTLRQLTVALAFGMLVAACRSAPDDTPPDPPSTAVPASLDRDAMAASLARVQERLAGGDRAALEELGELGEQALSFTDDEAATEVARLMVEAGQLEGALEYTGRARKRFPLDRGHKGLVFPQAQALDGLGRSREAAEAFDSALGLEPVNPFEYLGSADLWVAVDEFDRASAAVDAGLVRFPEDVFLLQGRAEVRLRRGDAEGALAELDRLSEAMPDEIGPQVLRMEALAALDRRELLLAAGLAFDEAYPLLGHGAVFAGLAQARGGDAAAAETLWASVEERIAICVECSTDQVELLEWARKMAGAETVTPLDR